MKRDTLMKRLINLPPDTDVLVKIGDDDIDIAEIIHVVDAGEPNSVALMLDQRDLHDTLTRRTTN